MNLYQLTGARLALQSRLEALNFDEQTIADTLEGESTELQAKLEDYGFVIRNMDAFTEAMLAEEVRMTTRRIAHEKRTAAIKDWLLQNMIACQISKIDCPAFTLSVHANPASVEVIDAAQIPPEYMRTPEPKPPVPAPDKRAILEALKAGNSVSGCVIKQTKRLVIK